MFSSHNLFNKDCFSFRFSFSNKYFIRVQVLRMLHKWQIYLRVVSLEVREDLMNFWIRYLTKNFSFFHSVKCNLKWCEVLHASYLEGFQFFQFKFLCIKWSWRTMMVENNCFIEVVECMYKLHDRFFFNWLIGYQHWGIVGTWLELLWKRMN